MEEITDDVGLLFELFHDMGNFRFEFFDSRVTRVFEPVLFQVGPNLFITMLKEYVKKNSIKQQWKINY